MANETKPDLLEREKLELERAKFEFEKEKHNLEVMRGLADVLRARNETVEKLVSTIRYLNEIQDGVTVEISGVVSETHKRLGRIWNAHEEDIANACLITLKQQLQLITPKE